MGVKWLVAFKTLSMWCCNERGRGADKVALDGRIPTKLR
jgi:hypothetical protein